VRLRVKKICPGGNFRYNQNISGIFFMSQLIDFILLAGFFAILIWAIIEYLPVIQRLINIAI